MSSKRELEKVVIFLGGNLPRIQDLSESMAKSPLRIPTTHHISLELNDSYKGHDMNSLTQKQNALLDTIESSDEPIIIDSDYLPKVLSLDSGVLPEILQQLQRATIGRGIRIGFVLPGQQDDYASIVQAASELTIPSHIVNFVDTFAQEKTLMERWVRETFCGDFIVIEGRNGSGKTTVATQLGDQLGLPPDNILESGNVLDNFIPRSWPNRWSYGMSFAYYMLANQFLADNFVAPAIKRGEDFIAVRYTGSSLTSYAANLQIPVASILIETNELMHSILEADITFYLEVDSDVSVKRMKQDDLRSVELDFCDKRQATNQLWESLELEACEYLADYLEWQRINTNFLTIDEVVDRARDIYLEAGFK